MGDIDELSVETHNHGVNGSSGVDGPVIPHQTHQDLVNRPPLPSRHPGQTSHHTHTHPHTDVQHHSHSIRHSLDSTITSVRHSPSTEHLASANTLPAVTAITTAIQPSTTSEVAAVGGGGIRVGGHGGTRAQRPSTTFANIPATAPPPSATTSTVGGHPPHPSQPHSSPQLQQGTAGYPQPYADESAFHTNSYAAPQASYDSSFSSGGSPWTPPTVPAFPPSQPYGYPMPPGYIYNMYPRGKEMEPILEPGELPAPRPPMSYAALIGEALLVAPPPHQLYVSEISDSIKRRYACE